VQGPADRESLLGAGYGALRDALGAIGNLEQALRSRNVAPRAISQVLPDMVAACDPLKQELARFFAALDEDQGRAPQALLPFIEQQLELLRTEMNAAQRGKRVISAAGRLSLERAVRAVERNLAGVLPLMHILSESVRGCDTRLDVVELLRLSRSGDQPQTPCSTLVRGRLLSDQPAVTLRATPSSAMTLFGVVGSCIPLTEQNPSLELTLQATSSQVALTFRAARSAPDGFNILLPPKTQVTRSCMPAAAHALDVQLLASEQELCLRWAPLLTP
jgi:hypothetical protein